MSRPVSPAEVEAELWRLSRILETTTDELPMMARRAAEAEVNYKGAHARELLGAQAKTVSDREAQALLLVEDKLMERRVAEALYDAHVEKCRTLRAQLNALQTISANMRGQV